MKFDRSAPRASFVLVAETAGDVFTMQISPASNGLRFARLAFKILAIGSIARFEPDSGSESTAD